MTVTAGQCSIACINMYGCINMYWAVFNTLHVFMSILICITLYELNAFVRTVRVQVVCILHMCMYSMRVLICVVYISSTTVVTPG